MRLLAIDPGEVQSAWVVYNTRARLPIDWEKVDNIQLRRDLEREELQADWLVVEKVESYGMPVGANVFATCVWAGRLIERWVTLHGSMPEPLMLGRKPVKRHLCGTDRAKDSNVRAAVMDLYGGSRTAAVGVKASPGPLYGMKADCWQALALAITVAETRLIEPEKLGEIGSAAEKNDRPGVVAGAVAREESAAAWMDDERGGKD